MKIQQMVFMLLAVTLFFVFVGIFFITFKSASLQEDAERLRLDKAGGLVERISSNPEFVFEGKSNAVDGDKLMILKGESDYVFIEDGKRKTFWGVKGIIVRKIYPVEEEVECTKDNYPDCNLIKLFTDANSAPISSFVSLCTKRNFGGVNYNNCELAKIMIEEEEINE
ncbi:hypothetical protein CMI46_02685 [Candidatus Pacearchaeota archaeon]|nr:hypothetical protein [Candidatus Pacearchaeota archaeon]|tara:strand:- start:282 stop:785 length:504 start_codon:yes stop_codon:yes gene_type:complete